MKISDFGFARLVSKIVDYLFYVDTADATVSYSGTPST